jgi:hypothetical protein
VEADALAFSYRFDPSFPVPAALPPPPGVYRPATVPTFRPVGALALVGRDGAFLWFEWGPPRNGLTPPPGVAVNAAEAIEQLLRVLSGTPEDEGEGS